MSAEGAIDRANAVAGFSGDGLHINWLLCWAYKPDIKGKLVHELNRDIYKGFTAAGIMIPFPQRDVHLIKKNDATAIDEV